MGNQTPQALNDDVSVLLVQFPPWSTVCTAISSTKLFKTAKCTDQQSIIFVKVFSTQGLEKQLYKSKLDSYNGMFQKIPQKHILLSLYIESDTLGVLYRPFIQTSLRQKMIRPPFVNAEEKNWLCFLMLKAVQELHKNSHSHRDIRPENFLLTSWDWVFITDLAFYKPFKIPEGDLTSYNLFFAPGTREACYVSPERFDSKMVESSQGALKSDIFSLGCAIYELFLDGAHLFTLPQLLAYKKGEIDISSKLSPLRENVREMIKSMLVLDPLIRCDINFCVDYWSKLVLPNGISTDVYAFCSSLLEKNTADDRLLALHEYVIKNKVNEEYCVIFCTILGSVIRNVSKPSLKILAIKLMVQLATTDDLKLHRVLPYLMSLLNKEERSSVKCSCLRSMAEILSQVKSISGKDTHLFKEYIWPLVSMCKNDENEWVRYTLADLLPKWAYVARRFLELGRYFDCTTDNFDSTLGSLGFMIGGIYKELFDHKEESIHLKLLSNFPHFAMNFTDEVARTIFREAILTWIVREDKHLDTVFPWVEYEEKYQIAILQEAEQYVNTLGGYFFRHAFRYLENNLYGHSELLVYLTLKTVNYHVRMNTDLLEKTLPYLLHPSQWIRSEMKNLIIEILKKLDPTMNFLHIRPMIIPYLFLHPSQVLIVDINTIKLHLYSNIRRSVFNMRLSGKEPELLPEEEKVRGIFSSLSTMVRLPVFNNHLPKIVQEPEEKTQSEGVLKVDGVMHDMLRRSFIGKNQFYEGLGLTGELEYVIDSHESPVTHINLSSDNIVHSASRDGKIFVWKFNKQEDYSKIKYRERREDQKQPLSMGNCGDCVFISYSNQINIWDQELAQIEQKCTIDNLASSCELDNYSIFISDKLGNLYIKDLRQESLIFTFNLGAQKGIISSMTGITDKSVALGTISGHIILIDLRFSIPAACYINSYKQPIMSLKTYNFRYKPLIDGTQLLSSLSSEILMWDLNTAHPSFLFTKKTENPLQVPYLTSDPFYYPEIFASPNSKGMHEFERSQFLYPKLDRLEQNSKISANFVTSLTEFGLLVKKAWETRSNVRKILVPEDSNIILTTGEDALVKVWDPISAKNQGFLGHGTFARPEYQTCLIPDLMVVQEQNLPPHSNKKKRRDFDEMLLSRKISHSQAINDMAFLTQPKPLLLTGSNDGTIRIWR